MAGMGHRGHRQGRRADQAATLTKYTILMVEHNLSVVANLSDVITVLTRGRVLARRQLCRAHQGRARQEGLSGEPVMAG